jgi:Ca2+-binding EF-hand superfamily protein
MRIHCSPTEAQQIFDSIDDDQSGTIQMSEFKYDYDKCIKMSLDDLVEEENRRFRNYDD